LWWSMLMSSPWPLDHTTWWVKKSCNEQSNMERGQSVLLPGLCRSRATVVREGVLQGAEVAACMSYQRAHGYKTYSGAFEAERVGEAVARGARFASLGGGSKATWYGRISPVRIPRHGNPFETENTGLAVAARQRVVGQGGTNPPPTTVRSWMFRSLMFLHYTTDNSWTSTGESKRLSNAALPRGRVQM
jgi:hypothetical protein